MLAPPVKNTASLMIVGLIILLGFKPAHAQVYWTDPLNTPPDQIITEIQIPVQDG